MLVGGITPELLADALVHDFGEGLGEAVGEGLDEDRGVVVVLALEALGDEVLLESGGDDEGADVVRRSNRRDEIGERQVGLFLLLGKLLAQGEEARQLLARGCRR